MLELLEKERLALVSRREALLVYMDTVVRPEEDWHGVMDCAADIREIEAKLMEVAWCLE